MLEPLILLGLCAVAIVIAGASYRRRAGVYAGAGRGAPASPLLVGVLAVLAAIGAVLIFFLFRGSAR
ncbi:MAG TPA: hypothetical protein VH331_17785 [Allosphingosinicella sp.]|nr:hypothetical protein [Allosphingosinicella sp.]